MVDRYNKSLIYKVHFLDSSKVFFKEILGIRGGTGDLKKFILKYKSEPEKIYPSWNPKKPVIIITDNDDGAGDLFSTIKKNFKKEIKFEDSNSFFPIVHNLYLIKTPHNEHIKKTCIEDMFNQEQLPQYNGKTFSSDNKYDKNSHYGKSILATRVLPKNF